ncbi:MAG TPA: HNH endonuclease [Acidimicrobiales bacterium]
MGSLVVIREHVDRLRAELAGFAPTALSGADAAAVVAVGVEIERLGAATCTRYARRVAETKAYDGYKSAANWLAVKTGESTGAAQGLLDVAEKLAEAPLVDEAFSDGRLSLAQAKVVAGAGAGDPASQEQLIGSATRQSFRELVDDARRIRRRALGEATEAAKEARAHRRRYVRVWAADEGGLRLEAWLPSIDGARVKAVLEDEANRVFKEAHAAGRREPAPAYLADALVHVVCGDAASRPKAHVELRVDAAALRRGEVDGDEVCEILGVGSVPVGVARDVLGDSAFRVVVTDGTDVRTVTSRKRTIREPLRAALRERDGGCAVPGCPNTRYLQIDHDWELSRGGPTQLDNLQLLCTHHHRLKTAFGFRLLGPPGERRWIPPPSRAR